MKPKGQILSLDFLLAMGLIVLLLGLVLKFGEVAAFEWQQKQQQLEIESTGKAAVLLLLSNPGITCELQDQTGQSLGIHINNCIDTENTINRSSLGLPAEYQFYISNESTGQKIASTREPDIAEASPIVFSADFNAIVLEGGIPKSRLYPCLRKQECSLDQNKVLVMVWK